METNVAQLGIGDRLLAWFELHKKEVLWGAIVIVLVGMGIGFYFWQQNERQAQANQALSSVTSTGFNPEAASSAEPGALLKVTADYPNTDAAARALLLAGAELYRQGKYSEARTQFEKFLREDRNSPFAPQAFFGVAACLDALGKTTEAITAYNDIIQHYSTDNVAPQAKLSLGRLYEQEGKWTQARDLFLELARASRGSISSEAIIHLEALFAKHPELVPTRSSETNTPALRLSNP
jgi:tetratricopeptide (TPR) repeat protein